MYGTKNSELQSTNKLKYYAQIRFAFKLKICFLRATNRLISSVLKEEAG